jgi:hypothetical protein
MSSLWGVATGANRSSSGRVLRARSSAAVAGGRRAGGAVGGFGALRRGFATVTARIFAAAFRRAGRAFAFAWPTRARTRARTLARGADLRRAGLTTLFTFFRRETAFTALRRRAGLLALRARERGLVAFRLDLRGCFRRLAAMADSLTLVDLGSLSTG